tara:strand:- start:74 stop:436 length:363 start_codon:yes stop_codon:yes gene_type:complete
LGIFDNIIKSLIGEEQWEFIALHNKLKKEFPDLPKHKYKDDSNIGYGVREGLANWFKSHTYESLSKDKKYEVCRDLLRTDEHGGNKMEVMIALRTIEDPTYNKTSEDLMKEYRDSQKNKP